jgi:hypothetical protein
MVSGGEIFEGLEMANPARKDRDRRVLAPIVSVSMGDICSSPPFG